MARRGFKFSDFATPPPRKAPKIKDIVIGIFKPLPPPDDVRAKLSIDNQLVMAIDVETHAFARQKVTEWRRGRFGFATKLGEEDAEFLRVVQVGWTIGLLGAQDVRQQVRLIKPRGFVIEAQATGKHGITQEVAEAKGIDISVALRDLCACAKQMHNDGGRICAHHLDFDARLLAREMGRLELVDLAADWEQIARAGLCTMDPDIGHWIRKQMGLGEIPRAIPIRLADAVRAMVPHHAALLANHHDAGTDSRMHWELACELMTRAGMRDAKEADLSAQHVMERYKSVARQYLYDCLGRLENEKVMEWQADAGTLDQRTWAKLKWQVPTADTDDCWWIINVGEEDKSQPPRLLRKSLAALEHQLKSMGAADTAQPKASQ